MLRRWMLRPRIGIELCSVPDRSENDDNDDDETNDESNDDKLGDVGERKWV